MITGIPSFYSLYCSCRMLQNNETEYQLSQFQWQRKRGFNPPATNILASNWIQHTSSKNIIYISTEPYCSNEHILIYLYMKIAKHYAKDKLLFPRKYLLFSYYEWYYGPRFENGIEDQPSKVGTIFIVWRKWKLIQCYRNVLREIQLRWNYLLLVLCSLLNTSGKSKKIRQYNNQM